MAPWAAKSESFVQAGGEMGAMMRAFDWSRTSLGPLASWPQSLRTSVSTMLRSPYPIILFWGPERRMLYNDPFRPILGTKHPGALGARGHEALAEEWKLLGPLMEQVDATGEPLYIENGNVNFARRPGGLREEAYFTWSYNPTIGEDGEIAGLFAIASETTRQVVGERRLGILRELSLRTALDKKVEDVFRSLDAVLVHAGHDAPFALLYVTDGERARLMSSAGLVRGSTAAPLEVPLDGPSPWPIAEVVRTREEQLVENLDATLGPLPGGPWPEPAVRALALPVPIGADAAAMAVLVVGLSPLGSLNDEYRSFLQLLARQVSASISGARAYEEERRRAEELAMLDRAKTAFFSNVSHELRTPLTLILGPVENALAQPARSLAGEPLEMVRRNALRLLKMVNTLLDFSRMEAGRAQATFVATDLAAFTASLASQFRSAVEGAGLTLRIDCAPLPEPIYVDGDMWEKIVFNLLSNAVKFTQQGEIRVSLHWEDQAAVLRVEDTGVGIPAHELPRVFERFYRVQATEGRSHEGTGIGLSLVDELVKLHGGQASVSSTLGQGSCFEIRLPRGVSHLDPAHVESTARGPKASRLAASFVEEAERWSEGTPVASPSAAHAALPAPHDRVEAHILVVDDNADLREHVSGLLSRAFSRVETAADGLDALEAVERQRPDLVLSDVMMPRMDGLALVQALRARPETQALPVILLSARAGDESTVDGLATGADDYLVKPFSARELLARVRTQLAMARVRREAARDARTKEELESELKARDEWLSIVSHELRTPLSAASLSMHALSDSVAPEALPGVKTLERSFIRLARQVEYLADVSELSTNHLTLVREPVDLHALVEATVDALRDRAARARSTLRVTCEPVTGSCDPGRVRELLSHLLDNALKFGAGKPIDVQLTRSADEAQITIVDHGQGIRAGDRARVFERFQRAVSVENFAGFGLGLWVARRLAEAHGGSITLSETEGGGATFCVRLPVPGVRSA